MCRANRAAVTQSNQFLPVTRPLSSTGEREPCSILVQGGDASAWPPFCLIVGHKHREEKRNTETMGRVVMQRFRPTRPPGRSGPLDRTAGGIGGAAPASLDLYGQSRTKLHFVCITSYNLSRGWGLHSENPVSGKCVESLDKQLSKLSAKIAIVRH